MSFASIITAGAVATTIALAVSTAPIGAQTAPALEAPAEPSTINAAIFVQRIEEANRFVLEASRLASVRAAGAKVKQYAQQMAVDHSRIETQLDELTTSTEWQRPNTPAKPSEKRAEFERKLELITTVTETEFDRNYMAALLDTQQYMVDLAKDFSTRGEGDRVVALARSLKETTERHLELAKRVPLPA